MPRKQTLADFRVPEQRSALPAFVDKGWFLAFDQTMTNTGWALLSYDGKPVVNATGMCKTEPLEGLTSFEGTYARLALLEDQMDAVVSQYHPVAVVHEMPAAHGMRTESALLAGYALRRIARKHNVPVTMYGAQKVKKAVTGNAKASKDEVKRAVRSLLPDIVAFKPLNEHVYDAAAIALTHMKVN